MHTFSWKFQMLSCPEIKDWKSSFCGKLVLTGTTTFDVNLNLKGLGTWKSVKCFARCHYSVLIEKFKLPLEAILWSHKQFTFVGKALFHFGNLFSAEKPNYIKKKKWFEPSIDTRWWNLVIRWVKSWKALCLSNVCEFVHFSFTGSNTKQRWKEEESRWNPWWQRP